MIQRYLLDTQGPQHMDGEEQNEEGSPEGSVVEKKEEQQKEEENQTNKTEEKDEENREEKIEVLTEVPQKDVLIYLSLQCCCMKVLYTREYSSK